MKDVQTALHAQLVGANRWAYCNKPINTNYSVASWEIPTIKVVGWLVKLGIRVVVYSGDQDAKIPFIGTRRLVRKLAEELKLKVTTEYTPWFVGEKLQVGGWIEEYGKWLSYAVIRGASHVAPATQPKRAFMLFDAFLQGKLLPIPQH
ncbi:serine carboxypeptidase-like 46 [Neltuma alba]|uniref:serine carboxypeptidase-like 46 n=1 Tax=Neltuma alba TaxID=207710 RepID=UPI0010A54673|nr:serine carboxypeptidase-like 46 [Prosopis alba]